MIIVLALLLSVALPAYAALAAWTGRKGGILGWLMKVVTAVAFMTFLSYVARWDMNSTYLPYLWWLLIVIGAALGAVKVWPRGWTGGETRRTLLVAAIEPAIALALCGYMLTGFLHPPATDAGFPLTGSRFLVIHGGSNSVLNYHVTNRAQRYALDIVSIDDFGRRAAGISPEELEAYVIDGAPISSPCNGEVTEVVDGIADNPVGTMNAEQPAGNHVIIRCGEILYELAHFKQGTIAVAEGQTVSEGRTLGQVGNSGNSSEPHLHIHAVDANGDGVPLTFGGVFPVRNTVIAR